MKVKLLPSSTEAESQRQALTTFLVNDGLAIDGGSIGFALPPAQMPSIRHIVVTHAHSDHTASLPIFVAEAFTGLEGPVNIYGLPEVVAALRSFVFNDQIWPDFEKIELPVGGPAIAFHSLEPRTMIEISGLRLTPIPVNHIVPTAGLLVEDNGASVIFTADTYTTDEIWRVAKECLALNAIFVDVSYPNELESLAAASRHFTPNSLAADLKKLGRDDVEVYAVHIKPTNREQVITQLRELQHPAVQVAEIGRTYEW
ncbi:MAG TPA: 3',5'-cyclic-nucleotide phosphodiesterase [Blastocatellia bacterium]|nr:3',5'-cyclic-nucleotide phosphodiesterase [Blastocatellia bacterium]